MKIVILKPKHHNLNQNSMHHIVGVTCYNTNPKKTWKGVIIVCFYPDTILHFSFVFFPVSKVQNNNYGKGVGLRVQNDI